MAKARFAHDQFMAVVLEIASGRSVTDVSRKYGISKSTIYRWKTKMADDKSLASERVRLLEIENRRLKNKFAELVLDYTSLRAALVKEVGRES
jgi:putative transposase